MAGVAYLTFFRKLKEQGNKYRVYSWLGVWGLTGYIMLLVNRSIYRNRKVHFADVAPQAGATPFGPRYFFQQFCFSRTLCLCMCDYIMKNHLDVAMIYSFFPECIV